MEVSVCGVCQSNKIEVERSLWLALLQVDPCEHVCVCVHADVGVFVCVCFPEPGPGTDEAIRAWSHSQSITLTPQ